MNSAPFKSALITLSWLIVFLTIFVSVWGVWVRVSGSGDGCGDHWPLCNGEVVPSAQAFQTWIEFFHRISTALYGVLVLIQFVLVRTYFMVGDPVRRLAGAALVFTIFEAAIGALLVKARLVNQSQDLFRLLVMPAHLVNTALLLAATVFTAQSLCGHVGLPRDSVTRRWLAILVLSFLAVITSGAVASLGSHIAPSSSLLEGFFKDLNQDSHLAVRLRILHPLLSIIFGALLILSSLKLTRLVSSVAAKSYYQTFVALIFLGIAVGFATLLLLAPIWLKLVHVTVANVLVVVLSLALSRSGLRAQSD